MCIVFVSLVCVSVCSFSPRSRRFFSLGSRRRNVRACMHTHWFIDTSQGESSATEVAEAADSNSVSAALLRFRPSHMINTPMGLYIAYGAMVLCAIEWWYKCLCPGRCLGSVL